MNPVTPGPAGWTLSLFGALYLVLVIAALVSIAKSTHPTPTVKVLWFLVVVVAPFLGSLVWFAFGRRKAPTQPTGR
ncbi:PLDc_N domain-containing protein [Arthrobacter sp. zg-ZUI100]|uniref:PLD nuclease N-terminal domain-containing protein n=1 Tax=Arthrobacter jiangjiafuii TaxID=2817475 RepID=A0A975M950_9MICC|nr:PLDc_N domain-containing protein [Arthrobacter jiangjiafuii]MBP3044370.1 PLDc_N domain-containing protein [Arthrobacter jiangjiafuii]QWC11711.1 PLD nuclease N-terminal domain-containing protein [Arthrobacter jiangjiafuii]